MSNAAAPPSRRRRAPDWQHAPKVIVSAAVDQPLYQKLVLLATRASMKRSQLVALMLEHALQNPEPVMRLAEERVGGVVEDAAKGAKA